MNKLKDTLPYTRHLHGFPLPQAPIELARQRNPDKALLRQTIIHLHTDGKSYRQIAAQVGIHWTRVRQIIKGQQ